MATTHARKRMTKHDLKTDAFTTSVFRAKEWAEDNMNTVLAVVVGIVVVVGAIWGVTSYRDSEIEAAQRLYGEAGVELRSNNPSVAIALYQKLVDEHSGSELAGPACVQLGQLHFRGRSFDDARAAYQRYIDDYGDSPYMSAAAHAGLGAIEEQAGFPEQAIPHYQQAVDVDPNGPMAPENLRRLIRAAIGAGDTAKALAAWETLDDGFPNEADNRTVARQMLIEKGFLPPN